jgi:AraC-like DNA-binding protein
MSKTRQPPRGDEHLLVRSYAVTHPRNLGIAARSLPEWDQLAYASAGVMTVHTPAGAWVVPPDRAVWIPAGAMHSVQTSGRVTLRTLFLRPALSRGQLPRLCVALSVSPLVRALVLHAAGRNMLRRDRADDRRLVRVLVDQLATLPHEPLRLPAPQDERGRAAAAHMERRPGDRLSTVARAAGASVRTLERTFLRETGMPLGRWRRRARMLASLRQLADGVGVTAVALEVGYQTPSAFVAAFRREMGTTPGRYFGHAASPRGRREA